MREGVFLESVFVGATTLALGFALMQVPTKHKAWPYASLFLLGFITHYGYEYSGLNKQFAGRMLEE